jgi:hypothetical protein
MRSRRFVFLTILFALVHGVATVVSLLISFGHGFNLDHPEMQSSFQQRVFGWLTNLLMQPGSTFWDSVGVTPKTSALEWAAMILNSLLWGMALALVALLFTHHKTTVTMG